MFLSLDKSSNFITGLVSIHYRHATIHDYESIAKLTIFACGLYVLKRFKAINSRITYLVNVFVARLGKQNFHSQNIHRLIIHDHYSPLDRMTFHNRVVELSDLLFDLDVIVIKDFGSF